MTATAALPRNMSRLFERIPWPVTLGGDLGKRRCAQR
jgi:hypothetical protein